MNEKEFEIGQRVRIIGPTIFGELYHIGKCFVIEEKDDPGWSKTGMHKLCGYSKHNCRYIWPAASLELAEPEYFADGQTVKIAPVKHNHSVISIDELLDRLEAIEQRLDSIEKRFQPPEDKAPKVTSAQEREDADYKLYCAVCRNPDSGVYDLAKEMGWSSDKAYGSLRRLVKDGWVMAVREGRSKLKIVPVKWHGSIEEFKKGDLQ